MKKRIVCFGDSNTWGFDAQNGGRYPDKIRWPCLLADLLGEDYQVIEEGLSGRTSVLDDPLHEGLNGIQYVYPCLMSHAPIEMVIIMLGTNDTKERFHLTALNIAQGIFRLVNKIDEIPAGYEGKPPKILVIAPPPIRKEYKETDVFHSMGSNCDEKSRKLPFYLAEMLENTEFAYLNAGEEIEMNDVDYMHLTEAGHLTLAKKVYKQITMKLF